MITTPPTGLSHEEAYELLLKHGENVLTAEKKENFFLSLIHI